MHTARCSACEGHSPRRSVRGHVLQWRLGTSAGRIDAPVEGVAVWPRAHAASGAPRSPASIYTIQPPASACHLTFGQYSTPVDLLSALPFLFGLAVVPSPQSPRHGGRLGAMEFFFNRLPVAIVPPRRRQVLAVSWAPLRTHTFLCRPAVNTSLPTGTSSSPAAT